MPSLKIILLCVATAVGYGIVHDQITARICVEYFTIGHPPVFGTDDPTLLGLGWGTAATWWVGLLIGVPLAAACRYGRLPKREYPSLIRPLLVLVATTFVFATVAGVAGFVVASGGWVNLRGDFAERVPKDRQVPFLVDLWAHSASYLAGAVGGMTLIASVVRDRRMMALEAESVRPQ